MKTSKQRREIGKPVCRIGFGLWAALIPLLVRAQSTGSSGSGGSSGAQNAQQVFGNLGSVADAGITFFVVVMSGMGFVIVGLSIKDMYAAAKDERKSPVSAFVGLPVGGALVSLAAIVGAMRDAILNGP